MPGTPSQRSDLASPSTAPFRWPHRQIAQAFDRFNEADPPASQCQFARAHDIPRATLDYWLRQDQPDGVDPSLVSFFRSSCGLALLRRIVLALFLAFLFRGACGLRSLGLFLRLTQMDRFVAASHGALRELAQTIEADLGAFADQERPRLAEGMAPKDIALVADEHFHQGPLPGGRRALLQLHPGRAVRRAPRRRHLDYRHHPGPRRAAPDRRPADPFQTLPCASNRPRSLGRFRPTGHGRPSLLSAKWV